jgi:hypothetical protein
VAQKCAQKGAQKCAKGANCALFGAKMSVNHIFVSFLAVCGPFRLILGHLAYFWATLDVVGEWAFWREKSAQKSAQKCKKSA